MIPRLNPLGLHLPIGTYAQVARAGDWVVTSGQAALDEEGRVVCAGDIAGQTRATIENIAAALAGAGAGLNDIVKMTVHLADYSDYPAMDGTLSEYFASHPPARATVLAPIIYPELKVEMEAWAYDPRASNGTSIEKS